MQLRFDPRSRSSFLSCTRPCSNCFYSIRGMHHPASPINHHVSDAMHVSFLPSDLGPPSFVLHILLMLILSKLTATKRASIPQSATPRLSKQTSIVLRDSHVLARSRSLFHFLVLSSCCLLLYTLLVPFAGFLSSCPMK